MAAAGLVLFPPTLHATSICRWVDESGRTQMAEAVPDRFRNVATCTDTGKYEASPAQRDAAQRRSADDRARLRSEAAKPPAQVASGAMRPARAASGPVAKRPSEIVTDATDCTTWWRIYDESVECFGPFRTSRGATKVEAFDVCNTVESPQGRCGPRVD